MSTLKRAEVAAEVLDSELWKHLPEVSRGDRISGSEDEIRCQDYMARVLAEAGFEVERLAPWTLIGYPIAARLEVVAPERFEIACRTYAFSPSTPAGGLEADLQYVGAGRASDYPAGGLGCAVALTDGAGESAKALAAGASGAVAQVFVNHDDYLRDGIISPVWGSPGPTEAATLPKAPTVVVRPVDGARLKRLLEAGGVRVRVTVETYLDWRPTPILVADLPGRDEDRFVIFSAHSDSWGEGWMDNGSGNAVQLEVARVLAAHQTELRRGLRIIAWSGHSHGRYSGSAWYADNRFVELRTRCACHVNADAIGAVGAANLAVAPTLAETYEFGRSVVKEIAGLDLGYRRMPSRMSEQSFLHLGVPSCFATLSEQPEGGFGWWIHTPEDLADKVSHENLLRDARIYAATLWDLCTLPVLPFDYAATAREIIAALQGLHDRYGDRLDLSAEIGSAAALATELDGLGPATDAEERNALLIALAHVLTPVNYSAAGPFHQDPAVNPHPALPGLAVLSGLEALEAGSPAERMLLIEATRQRNRVALALHDARALVRAALVTRTDSR